METWVLVLIDVLVVIVVFVVWYGFLKWKYSRSVQGKIYCEFWRHNKSRYRRLLTLEANGIEVKAPQKHIIPRYFVNRDAVDMAKYPSDPILGLKALQVDVPICSWEENNPEPINPYTRERFVSASLLASTNNEDFLAFASAASTEIKELETELAKAYASRINKNIMYVMFVICIVTSGAAAYFSYLCYGG
jgi:hypothetical protein